MSRFIEWVESWLYKVWALFWMVLITGISVGGIIWTYQWIMRLVGAM